MTPGADKRGPLERMGDLERNIRQLDNGELTIRNANPLEVRRRWQAKLDDLRERHEATRRRMSRGRKSGGAAIQEAARRGS